MLLVHCFFTVLILADKFGQSITFFAFLDLIFLMHIFHTDVFSDGGGNINNKAVSILNSTTFSPSTNFIFCRALLVRPLLGLLWIKAFTTSKTRLKSTSNKFCLRFSVYLFIDIIHLFHLCNKYQANTKMQ